MKSLVFWGPELDRYNLNPYTRKLFDYVSHNGNNYLNGHDVVTLVLLIPLLDDAGSVQYVRVVAAQALGT